MELSNALDYGYMAMVTWLPPCNLTQLWNIGASNSITYPYSLSRTIFRVNILWKKYVKMAGYEIILRQNGEQCMSHPLFFYHPPEPPNTFFLAWVTI